MKNKIRFLLFLILCLSLNAGAQSNNGTLSLTSGSQTNLSNFNSFISSTFTCSTIPNASTFDIDLSYTIPSLTGSGFLACDCTAESYWVFELINNQGGVIETVLQPANYNPTPYSFDFTASLPNIPGVYKVQVYYSSVGFNEDLYSNCSINCTTNSNVQATSNTIQIQYPASGATNFQITSNLVNGINEVCSYSDLKASVSCVTIMQAKIEQLDVNGNSLNPQSIVATSSILYSGNVDFKDLGFTFIEGQYYNLIIDKLSPLASDNFKIKYLESFNSIQVANAETCEGQNVTLNASGPGTLNWSPSTFLSSSLGTSVVAVSPNAPVIYTVTSNIGCNIPKTMNLSINPNPVINFSANPQVTCEGGVPYQIQHTITENGQASTGGTYAWGATYGLSSFNTASPNWDPTGLPQGNTQGTKNFTLNYTSSEGCSTSESFSFFYSKLDVSVSEGAVVCLGGGNSPTKTLTANVTGGVAPYTYEWSDGTTVLQTGSFTNFEVTSAGTYTVSVTDANGSGCNISDSKTVTLPQPIVFGTYSAANAPCALPSSTNNLGTVTFAAPSGGASPYELSRDGGINWYPFTAVQGFNAGSHPVMVKDQAGCTVSQTVDVYADAFLDFYATTSDALCAGQYGTILINGSVSGASFGDYRVGNGSWNLYSSNPTTSSKPAGYYSVSLRDATNTCTVIKNIDVNNDPIQIINTYNPFSVSLTSNDNSCPGVSNGSANAVVTLNGGGLTSSSFEYTWSDGTIYPFSSSTSSSINGLLEGSAGVFVEDDNGCTESQNIAVNSAGNSDWQNYTHTNELSETHIKDVITDEENNVYVAGVFKGEPYIANYLIFAPNYTNEQQFFVAKFNDCGDLVWIDYSNGQFYEFFNGDIRLAFETGPSPDYSYVHVVVATTISGIAVTYDFIQEAPYSSTNTSAVDLDPSQDQCGWVKLNAESGIIENNGQFGNYIFFNNPKLKDIAFKDNSYTTLYAAGNFESKAAVLELDVANANPSSILPTAVFVEDLFTGNIINAIDFDDSDNLYAVGQMFGETHFGDAQTLPSGTSDAFYLYYSNTNHAQINKLESSSEAEAIGVEVLDNGRIAVAGNYSGTIFSYDLPGLGYFDNGAGIGAAFIADLNPGGDFGANWIASIDNAYTIPYHNSNTNSATCTAIASRGNDVIMMGAFEGSELSFSAGYGSTFNQATANGGGNYTHLWNSEVSGFNGNSANINWVGAIPEIQDFKPVGIATGSDNNFLIGDFSSSMWVSPYELNAGQSIGSFIIRSGDVYDPNMGDFYKKEEESKSELLTSDFTLYPNPTDGFININWEAQDGNLNYQVIDLSGRVLHSSNAIDMSVGHTNFDASSLSSGVYLIEIATDTMTEQKQFIKH